MYKNTNYTITRYSTRVLHSLLDLVNLGETIVFFASRKRICPGNTIFFVAPLSIFTQRRCQHTDKSSATVNIFLAPLGALAGLDF